MDVIAYALAMAVRPKTVRHTMPPPASSLYNSSRTLPPMGVLDDGSIAVQAGRGIPNNVQGQVQKFTRATKTWSAATAMPNPRFDTQGVAVGRIIYFPGGSSGMNPVVPTNTMQAYDVDANTWTAKAVMPHVKQGCGGFALDHLIYVFGGFGGGNSTVLEFNTITNTWASKTASGGVSGGNWGAKASGVGYAGWQTTFVSYDNVAHTFTNKATKPFQGAFGSLTEDLIVVAGGSMTANGSSDVSNGISVYNPTTNTWTVPTYDRLGTTENMVLSEWRAYNSVVGFKDGTFLTYGQASPSQFAGTVDGNTYLHPSIDQAPPELAALTSYLATT